MSAAPGPRCDRVLVAGISARAAAESAARAGYAVTALDAFADLDQGPGVRAFSLPRDFKVCFTANAAARAARAFACHAAVYLSGFENHPRAVATLSAGRKLWGNPPPVLRRVRDPWLLAGVLRRRGLPTPDLRSGANDSLRGQAAPSGRWLVKPRRSGGGHGVRRWRTGTSLPRGFYLQELIEGTPASAVFVASGGRAALLGVSRQLIGDRAFSATGYRYCGSILSTGHDAHDVVDVSCVSALVGALVEEFGLVGLNGVDFIVREGAPYAIEVNPRWSASMELVERVHGISMFGAHAAACTTGELPAFDVAHAGPGAPAVGKAVVFARRSVVVGDTHAWLSDDRIRDVPHPGDRIRAGRPVCTVFAEGRDAPACHAALVDRAAAVYAAIARWNRRVA